MISEKTRLKMRLAKLGKKRPKAVIEKIRLTTILGMKDPRVIEKMRIAKIGKPSNNKGHKCSKEQIKRMSEAHKGQKAWNKGLRGCYKQSKETIEKRVSKMRGKNNLSWKGGITPKNVIERNSVPYREWRNKVYKRDDWTCQKCNEKGGRLHVHHIKQFSEYEKLRFKINNGITLCKKCHNEFHRKYGIKNNNNEQVKEFLSSNQKVKKMEKYIFERKKELVEFICSNCKRKKKSKNIATNSEGKKLCNGCYGELLSKRLIERQTGS